MKLHFRQARRARGTAMVMVILMSVVLTGLVLAIAWSAGTQAQIAGASVHLDQANMAAESAGQWAVWQFKKDNLWRQSAIPVTMPTMAIGGNTFTYGVTCVDAGLAATLYWPFNEGSGTTTADTSGHGNTGQIVGGVTWVPGKYGEALSFDGTTGYVNAGNNASTDIVGSVTMSAWVKMNSAGQDQKVGGNQDGVAGGYKMSIYGLRVEFEVRDANNVETLNRNVAGGTILTMGVWYNVAGVFNTKTNTIKTYVNGVLDRELDGVPASALASTAGSFIMGREPWILNGTTRYFDGCIDDVRVYNTALTDQELKTLADTSVHIHATAQLHSSAAILPAGAVDFVCSAPTPSPPIAPALTVGGKLNMQYANVSGDVQVTGSITGSAASSVNGRVTYGTTYSDPQNYIAITYQGKSGAATKNALAAAPTIQYASIKAQATSTVTAGSNQTLTFTPQYNGSAVVIYVNGNVTDPVIDSSAIGGTVLINGNLTLTKNATYGASGFPVYLVVEKNLTHTGGTLNVTGGLYVGGNWSHVDCNIIGDTVVGGNVTDNSDSTGSSYVVGGIAWFDPRSSSPSVTLPLYYTDYQGVTP